MCERGDSPTPKGGIPSCTCRNEKDDNKLFYVCSINCLFRTNCRPYKHPGDISMRGGITIAMGQTRNRKISGSKT